MFQDGGKRAFQQAIPHGMVVFVSLLKVVIFGSSWGSRNGLSWGPEMAHLGTENEVIWRPDTDSCEDRFGDRNLVHLGTEMNSFWDNQTR